MTPFLFIIFLLLSLLSHLYIVDGEQFALRARSVERLRSRSLPTNLTVFNPTSEEAFNSIGGKPTRTLPDVTFQAS